MRKIIAAALVAAAAVTAAPVRAQGGPWDGIYSCTVNVLGQRLAAFVAINGYPDGTSVWTLPAVEDRTPFNGWGGGSIVGNVFSGYTMFGRPFRFEGNNRAFSGWIEGTAGGVVHTGTGTCNRIF
jgi:hypothetical protein